MLYDIGRTDYRKSWAFQKELVELSNLDLIDDTVIFLEHPDTFTAGIHTGEGSLPPDTIRVERGGGVTYHGPGQIVIYFIVNLKKRHMNVRDLIVWVHGVLVDMLKEYGLSAESRLGRETGVWVGSKKIASTGFAVDGFTTFHGTAINVTTDLSKFQRISPCGFDPMIMTSMQSLLENRIEHDRVKNRLEEMIMPILDP